MKSMDFEKPHDDLVALAMRDRSMDELLECFTAEDRHVAQAIREAAPGLVNEPWFSPQGLLAAVTRYRATRLMPALRELARPKRGAVTELAIIMELRQAQEELREAAGLISHRTGFNKVAAMFEKASERVSAFADKMEGKR